MKHAEPRIKIRFWSHITTISMIVSHKQCKWKVKAGMNALQNMTTFWWLGESRRNQTSWCWIVIVNKHHMFPWRKGVHAVVCNYLGYTFSIIITYYLFLRTVITLHNYLRHVCNDASNQWKEVSTRPLAASLKPSYSTRWKIQDMTPALADWPSAQENAHFMVSLQQKKVKRYGDQIWLITSGRCASLNLIYKYQVPKRRKHRGRLRRSWPNFWCVWTCLG